jgi:hypothetical protein
MVGSDFSENFNLEQAFQTIPEEIHEELIVALCKQTCEEGKLEEFATKFNSSLTESSLAGLDDQSHFHFDDIFLKKLTDRPQLVAALPGCCMIGRVLRCPCTS